ncbi:hypothetical protein vBBceHLY2_00144 [Bacillus phage vB_BceH_LY2]|nr:hypothetical protein vBBceHLY2_00144 [Bacillus phage vB_BceH_LY2]
MGLNENMKLRSKLTELSEEITNDIHHGECFYDLNELDDFLDKLKELRTIAVNYYHSNLEEE